MAAISGRRVAIRMTIIGGIVMVIGVILAVYYADLEFIVFGLVGVLGTTLSSIAAIAGENATAVATSASADDAQPQSGD